MLRSYESVFKSLHLHSPVYCGLSNLIQKSLHDIMNQLNSAQICPSSHFYTTKKISNTYWVPLGRLFYAISGLQLQGEKKHMLECQFQLMWPQEILGLLIVYCCGPLMLYISSDRESFWHAAWRAGAVSSNPKSSPTLQYCKLSYSLFNQINVFL